jgi:hypothetical protein
MSSPPTGNARARSVEESEALNRRSNKRPFPSRRVAGIGFVALVGALVAGTAGVILKDRGMVTAQTAESLVVPAIMLGFFVGLPCLFVPIIALVAAALERRQSLSRVLYRLGMLIIGLVFAAVCVLCLSVGFFRRAIGSGVLATLCLWYGAIRAENPEVH